MKPKPLPSLLICDDDSLFHLAVKQAVKERHQCRSAYNTDEALAIVRNHPVDAVLLDVEMRTPDEGLHAIAKLRAEDPDLAIVMSSGRSDFETVREAMRAGAADYVPKDFLPNDLLHVLERAAERRSLLRRREQQNLEVSRQQRQHVLIGETPQMSALRSTVERIRKSPANAVIFGETGTGKEAVARQLRGTLPDGSLAPFVAVDASTIQSSTAESVLFGHEKGAFTGADQATRGIFEEADGGIVYFDEIANMSLDIQAKLLRVIQEKEFVRLGSSRTVQSDFRVICATNRNLEELCAKGLFKDDLWQRLNVLPVELPPLRERSEDIPLLADHFLKKQARPLRFSQQALEVMKSYAWPGNVRELANLVAYVAAMSDDEEIGAQILPAKFRATPKSADEATFYDKVAVFERELLAAEYLRSEKNISKMAQRLGMDRSHLYSKLKDHGIHPVRK
jgi:DNA-binding NtrC family response regulator